MNEPSEKNYATFGRYVAALLGSNSEWDSASDYLAAMAEVAPGLLGVDVGGQGPIVQAMWGTVANELGIENDAPSETEAELLAVIDDVREHRGDYVGGVEAIVEELTKLRALIRPGGAVYEEVRFGIASDSMAARNASFLEIADSLNIPLPPAPGSFGGS